MILFLSISLISFLQPMPINISYFSILFISLSTTPHHLHKLHFGEYPFLHKQLGEGFLLDYLRNEEFFKLQES